jgi:hypothetical protein
LEATPASHAYLAGLLFVEQLRWIPILAVIEIN